jgi:hypothetical protein
VFRKCRATVNLWTEGQSEPATPAGARAGTWSASGPKGVSGDKIGTPPIREGVRTCRATADAVSL